MGLFDLFKNKTGVKLDSPTFDGYHLAYHYDSVKFYPPIEMVSKIDRKLLRSGADVTLKPEPKNKYDNRAIALYVSKHQIGYLLRGTLQDMVHDYNSKNGPSQLPYPVSNSLTASTKATLTFPSIAKMKRFQNLINDVDTTILIFILFSLLIRTIIPIRL